MKTIVEFKNGATKVVDGAAPSVFDGGPFGELYVSFVDREMGCVDDDIEVEVIQRVIFEP